MSSSAWSAYSSHVRSPRTAPANVRGGGVPGRAADGEQRHPRAVQAHLELLPVLEAAHVVVELPLQANLDVVLGIEGKVVSDRDAAARPERQILAHAEILKPHRGDRVDLGRRLEGRVAHREAADPARREDVAVEQRRRHREDVRHVVEAEIRVVGRQQRAAVDIERQQVAHRVGVLAPVQPVDGGAARIRVCRGGKVQGVLERGGDGVVGGRVGPPPAGRRHRAGPQLAHHLFPGVGVVAHACGVQRVQH